MSELADKSPEVKALKALLDLIAAGKVRVYRSLNGLDYLACHGKLSHFKDDLPEIDCPFTSDDALAWVTSFGFQECDVLLKRDAVMRMLRVLKTRAMLQPVTAMDDSERLQVLQSEPTVAAVVEFMHRRKGSVFETTMEELYQQLKKFAAENSILSRGAKRFPGGANVLGRQLRSFSGLLKDLGVRVHLKRSDGSKVTLTRLDSSCGEPSADPSVDNPNNSNDLAHEDGTIPAGRTTGVIARIVASCVSQRETTGSHRAT